MTLIKFYWQTDLNNDQNYFENVASNIITTFAKDFTNNETANSEFKNINKNTSAIRIKHGRGRTMKYSARINQTVFDVCFVFDDINIFQSSSQFQTFQLKNFFFEIIHHKNVFINARIFNFQFVDEIKHFDINKTFEKSWLIIQTYNDMKKNLVLTQTFIIQWISQRLVVCRVAVGV